MKRFFLLFFLSLALALSGIRLAQRWREEAANRTVAVVVEWSEVREMTLRLKTSDREILSELKKHQVTAVLTPGLTLSEAGARGDSKATQSFVESALRHRGVTRQPPYVGESLAPLREIELGIDPEFRAATSQAGLRVMLRLNRDPWIIPETFKPSLGENWGLRSGDAILMNAENVPGGKSYTQQWARWMNEENVLNALFEFKPGKAALRMAAAAPRVTHRSHTISSAELKDLTEDQIRARWKRAVGERSCRILLVHMGLQDSWPSFLERIDQLTSVLLEEQWTLGWPRPHATWSPVGTVGRLASWLALIVAIISPWFALNFAWCLARGVDTSKAKRFGAFLLMTGATVLGGVVVAGLADNSLTRLQVMPFRGVKLAFLISWVGSVFFLYSRQEIEEFLKGNLRRLDLICGILLLSILGFAVIRSGNASPVWKSSAEQRFRDRMESSLVARPRFKEFALGHPLTLVGFLGLGAWAGRRRQWDRALIAAGMMGQASIVNSFCHLHSPLGLAFGRTATGLIGGIVIGGGLYLVIRTLERGKSNEA